jgi:hypothetical protein
MSNKRISRIQALRKVLNKVNDLDSEVRSLSRLCVAAITISLSCAVLHIGFYLLCM